MEIEGTLYELLAQALKLVKTETGAYADPHGNRFILTKYGFQDVTIYGPAYIDQLKFKHHKEIQDLKKRIGNLALELDDYAHRVHSNRFGLREFSTAVKNYRTMKFKSKKLENIIKAYRETIYNYVGRDGYEMKKITLNVELLISTDSKFMVKEEEDKCLSHLQLIEKQIKENTTEKEELSFEIL